MGIPDDVDNFTRTGVRSIEAAGFRVSLHRMTGYVEAHAVPATDPESFLHLARVDGGGGTAVVHRCVVELAAMVCVNGPMV